ncbi:Uncharacterised protein [Staphylococcus epidermidis]|uniref:hypothetical protein n=1 Tax=Staphylococcus epidermidis TaxID=1282 RepID=UPI000E035E72|nr:hypothetical protein [Staphylococcus epidermidis]SUM53511.1 Uncharacterised protein [Staphylococcus epidermidis]SUM53528.1 Uncharacterised protein [Staphylococcus epidermidis]
MKRLAGITFTDKGATGNTVGYMEYVTGVVKVARYVVGYCVNRKKNDRFIVEFNGHVLNLSHYVNRDDIERMEQSYMNKRLTDKEVEFLTIQLNEWTDHPTHIY